MYDKESRELTAVFDNLVVVEREAESGLAMDSCRILAYYTAQAHFDLFPDSIDSNRNSCNRDQLSTSQPCFIPRGV